MDRVDNINKLQGWRSANGEELKLIQGILLKDAKKEAGFERILNIVYVICSYLCITAVGNIFSYIKTAFEQGDVSGVIFLCVVALILILILGVVIRMFINNLRIRFPKQYREAIKNNRIRVNEVEIYEVLFLRDDIGTAVLAPRAKVKDRFNVYCEEEIIYECCNKCQKTKALLFEIIISEDSKERNTKRYVIPCKEYDSKLWNRGTK